MGLISDGTTIFDAGALDSGLAKGALTFIKKLTASGSGTLSFVHGSGGVDFSTHKEYVFIFNNIHAAANEYFTFNMSVDAGSNYNVAKTTTFFTADHQESNDDGGQLSYVTSSDLAQGTGFQFLHQVGDLGGDADQNLSGSLTLFNPSDTTFVKHFISCTQSNHASDYAVNAFIAGYGNTTSDVDAIRFSMASGNIDAGDICLYGIT